MPAHPARPGRTAEKGCHRERSLPSEPSGSAPQLDTELTGASAAHPVVQTGWAGWPGPLLVGAVAEAGGMGILASATMSYPELAEAIKETRARTAAQFGVEPAGGRHRRRDRVELLIKSGRGGLVRAGSRAR